MQAGQGQAQFPAKSAKVAEATKSGFTLIEVMLTLAIAGAIFVGLVGGLSGTVARQRYSTEVDKFAEYLRNAYSEVSNPQGSTESGGNSTTQAIYGRLLVLGYSETNENGQYIADYSVLGSVDATSARLNFNLSSLNNTEIRELSNTLQLRLDTSNFSTYTALNGVTITTPEGDLPEVAILIMRNLSGGSIRTYVYECENTGNGNCIRQLYGGIVNMTVGDSSINTDGTVTVSSDGEVGERFDLTGFAEADVNFCVVSSDSVWAGGTRNVRLLAGGNGSNAVQIVDQDSEDNLCQGLNS